MINQGFGAPIVRIYNNSDTLVLDGVTRFKYVRSEKVDDASYITIESDNSELVDHKDFQEKSRIKLVWGYSGGEVQKRVVYIWDVKVNYSSSGVRIELECYCKAAYMKLNSSKDVWNETDLEQVGQKMADAYGLDYKTENIDPANESTVDPTKFGDKTIGKFDFNQGNFTTARDNTAFVVKTKYVFKKQDVAQANRNDRKVLNDMAATEPVDNLFIDGTDDSLLIKRRNFLQAPVKAYTFKGEPGHLLSFVAATKNNLKKKQAISNTVAGWLEEEKEYFQGQIDRSHSGAGVLGDVVELPLEQNIINKLPKSSGIANPLDRPITIDGLAQLELVKDESGQEVKRLVVKEKIDSTKQVALMFRKRGTQPSKFVMDKKHSFYSSAIDNTGRIETKGLVIVDPKEYLPTVETKPAEAAGLGVNRQSQQELDLNCGSATVLGDPSLVCSKVITLRGLAKKHNGNYYIVSVEHEITPENGYLCYLSIYRTGANKIGVEDDSKSEARLLGMVRNITTITPEDGTRDLINIPTVPD